MLSKSLAIKILCDLNHFLVILILISFILKFFDFDFIEFVSAHVDKENKYVAGIQAPEAMFAFNRKVYRIKIFRIRELDVEPFSQNISPVRWGK